MKFGGTEYDGLNRLGGNARPIKCSEVSHTREDDVYYIIVKSNNTISFANVKRSLVTIKCSVITICLNIKQFIIKPVTIPTA